VRLVVELESDRYELLDWGAKQLGYADLGDYTLDL
jgi:hypothetical protein